MGNQGCRLGNDMRKRKSEPEEPPGVTLVDIEEIVRNRRFQVRDKIDDNTVRQYAVAMKAGEVFPPVRLARIKGALVLIDGWHRLEARVRLAARARDRKEGRKWLEVPATIEDMTEREARWAAATANLTHGLRLKRNAREAIFSLFMRTKRYRKADGTYMSSREISSALKGLYSHTAVLKKIQRNHPRVYEDMRRHGEEVHPLTGESPYNNTQEPTLMREDALGLLEEVRMVARVVTDKSERRAIYDAAKQLLAELEAEGVPEPDDF